MIINTPKVRKEITLDLIEREHVRHVSNLLSSVFNNMKKQDLLEIEDYDETSCYKKETVLDVIRFLDNMLDLVYIQEVNEQDE